MTFEKALRGLMILEGGFTVDDGGPTEVGITQSAWDGWCQKIGQPSSPIESLSQEDIQTFYRNAYWTPLLCPQLPDGVDFCLFQWAINHEYFGGDGPAVRDLQMCCGTTPDGCMGPETAGAACGMDRVKLMQCLLGRQEAWYKNDAKVNADAPLVGWENRVDRTRKFVGLPAA